MKTEITNLMTKYREALTALNTDIRVAQETEKAAVAKYKIDPSKRLDSLFGEIESAREVARGTAITINDKLKEIVEEAKSGIIPRPDRPADYAVKVSNALQFLGYQLDGLTDKSAYAILKDFTSDFDQMQLFRGIIEKRGEKSAEAFETRFPKTFSEVFEVESKLTKIAEIEGIAKNLFIHPMIEGGTIPFGNVNISLADVGYEQLDGEERILALAADLFGE